MAGNEILITEYLFDHINVIEIPHIGIVRKISIPTRDDIREIKAKTVSCIYQRKMPTKKQIFTLMI